ESDMNPILYDTTLRDGTQREGLSLSAEDKVRIACRLDALGIGYIEGGWPGSNPKDAEFFRRIAGVPLRQAKIAAFGMTRHAGGALPTDVEARVWEVRDRITAPLGIHPHNDSGLALANALAAVEAGCVHVQGTINGYGERCGNLDLVQLIATLQLKLEYQVVAP